MLTPESTQVSTLGARAFKSPLNLSTTQGDGIGDFVPDEARVLYCVEVIPGQPCRNEISFEKAGPREFIYFRPEGTRAAIVTCGGLCPGINNVIRSIFMELHYHYGVKDVLGIRYGYQGLNPAKGKPPISLTRQFVETIHREGGSVLGSSRGAQDPRGMVDYLKKEGVRLLFCVGGDGTQRAVHRIYEEISRRGLEIAVVGIPKTIDNDILFVSRTFGFATALEKAREVIDCAHNEARGAPNGIGLVKLMGRDAGFIAAGATLASQEVNFCLIPEVPFALGGEGGFLEVLKKRILARGHAVIVVAEGAGQDLMGGEVEERDASGNVKHQDIGVFLKDRITEYFAGLGFPMNLKYFDPSYFIRSVPANGDDSLMCNGLARHAVHAALAGKTDVLIGLWNDVLIHVPIPLAIAGKKRVSPEGELWMGVIEATGQPEHFAG
jgi:6-phosphofructokinase 1